jgi:hypothetical protein
MIALGFADAITPTATEAVFVTPVIAAEVWIVESGKTTPFNVDKGIC